MDKSLIRQPDITIKSKFLRRGYFVYEWRRGEESLYVGATSSILNRFGGHHVIGKQDAFGLDDEVRIWRLRTFNLMMGLETIMIYRLSPKFNKSRLKSASRFCRICECETREQIDLGYCAKCEKELTLGTTSEDFEHCIYVNQ